jgi:hypothetical protein
MRGLPFSLRLTSTSLPNGTPSHSLSSGHLSAALAHHPNFRTIPIHLSDLAMQSICWLDLSSPTCPSRSGCAPSVHLHLPYGSFRLGLHHLLQSPEFGSFVTTSSVALSDNAYASYKRLRIMAASFGIPFKSSEFVPPSPYIVYIGFLLDVPQ